MYQIFQTISCISQKKRHEEEKNIYKSHLTIHGKISQIMKENLQFVVWKIQYNDLHKPFLPQNMTNFLIKIAQS